ncbi:MAG TPA: D-2-hydroxyacid dehydrogenase [Bacteroidota bacterium]
MRLLTNAKFSQEQLDSLEEVAPGIEVVRELDPAKAREKFRDAEIFCGFELPGPLEEAANLKWIQLTSAGAEHLLKSGIAESDVAVTTASGIHAPAIAEYCLFTMVTLARGLREILKESDARQWRPRRTRVYYGEELKGKTVGILGLGAIGNRIATVARCFEMRVVALRRSARQASDPEVFGPDRLMEMLPLCDFVVVTLPLTDETRGLLGEEQFRAMKPSAFLINVARGQIVQEQAMVHALREGWIAGAAVDVFAQEPLPPDSELWDVPNLLVTPHIAGAFSAYLDRVMDILRENLRRFVAGESMINVLDKQRGY